MGLVDQTFQPASKQNGTVEKAQVLNAVEERMANYLNSYVALDIIRGSRIIEQIGQNTTVPQLGADQFGLRC